MSAPAVVEVVLSRWVLVGAVVVILGVVAVLSWTAAAGAALGDERDAAHSPATLMTPGTRVYHPGYGIGTVSNSPPFGGAVLVDFDDDRPPTGARLIAWHELSPVDPDDERHIADLLDRGAVLYFGPRPSPVPVPPPGSPLAEAEALLASYTPCGHGVRCQWHDPEFCTGDIRCCPTCPTNPERTTRP